MPLAAFGLFVFYALTLSVSWNLGAGRLKVDEVQFTTDDLTMKNPKYFGLTKDGGSYEVRAKKAILEFSKDAPVKLVDIDGDLRQTSNVTTKLKAKHGLLDNAKSELELYDGIEIDASNGMKARLSRAMVYSKEHRIVSKEPVDLTMPAGRVLGSAMTLRTDTREATFLGNVRTRLVPAAQPGDTRPATPAFGANSREPVDVTSDQLYSIRSPAFRWIAVAFTLSGLATTAVSVHLVPLLLERGHGAAFAGGAMGALGLMALPGRLVFTPLGGRWSRGVVTASIFALSALAVVVLLATRSVFGVWFFVALFGAGFGAITPARAALVGDLVPASAYGRVSGTLAMIVSFARATAPVGASLLYAAAGGPKHGYDAVLVALLLLCVASGAAVLAADRVRAGRARPAPTTTRPTEATG
jgi:LPS export ABC transporter protein LptC